MTVIPRWSAATWARLPRLRGLPPDCRTLLQHVVLGGGVARSQSDAMRALEARLARGRYAAVIAHLVTASPGVGRFLTARHPRVLISSLDGLASELRLARWFWLPRLVARLAPGRLHRDLYRPLRTGEIRSAVFGSEAWRDDAVRAGLSRDVTCVIHFGVPRPAPLVDLPAPDGRLLWVGRLSQEKGLHMFLDALALLRRRRRATLTAICGLGPERYRREILRQIARLGLADAVRLRPAVPRSDLRRAFLDHDALLFHSAFREPVALVLMEAYSAGLPVVAPFPTERTTLIEPNETCVCFGSSAPDAVASAVARVLDDEALRRHVRVQAHARILERFSLDAMADAYDHALRSLLGWEADERSTSQRDA